jgi:hypothetical protein
VDETDKRADRLDKPQTPGGGFEPGQHNQRRREGWSPVSPDGQADKAPLPNHALAARMKEKGFSEARLATAAGVDTKTVGR